MSISPAKVLLAMDGSAEADVASRAAVELAERIGAGLYLIYVWPVPLYFHPEWHGYSHEYETQREAAQNQLDELVEKLRVAGGSITEAHLAVGPPDKEIVAAAEEIGVGLIVLGSRGLSGLRRSLLGSVSESVMRHAHSPVLVVRSPGTGQREIEETSVFPTKILVATDGSQSSARAIREAVDLALQTDSELHVAHVLPVSALYSSADIVLAEGIPLYDESRREARLALAEDVERAKEAGTAAESHLLEGRPDAEIVALAEEIGAGMIVVGSRGLGALARTLVGSTSTSIVRHAHCPVMVVRREEDGPQV